MEWASSAPRDSPPFLPITSDKASNVKSESLRDLRRLAPLSEQIQINYESMKNRSIIAVTGITFLGLLVPLLSLFAAPIVEVPRWWIGRGVLDPTATRNDRAVASVGQVKHFATQAELEFDTTLFEGSDLSVWPGYLPKNTDHNVANIAQIKNASYVFWDRLRGINSAYTLALIQEHDDMSTWTVDYPWSDPVNQKQHSHKVATIGDLKMVFGFALRRDADGDGLVDYQELRLMQGTGTPDDEKGADPNADFDGDDYSNIAEALAGTDATAVADKPKPEAAGDLDVFTVFE